MKILIVDDEVIIRTGLAKVINWHELGLELLTPAASAEEAIERIPVENPDILLTDIRMTGKTGLELIAEAKKIKPNLEAIILTGYDDFIYLQKAIRQNVSDYLLKTSKPEEIIKTVLKIKQRIEDRRSKSTQDHFNRQIEKKRFIRQWIASGDLSQEQMNQTKHYFDSIVKPDEQQKFKVILFSSDSWGQSQSSQSLFLFALDNALNDLLTCISFLEKNRVVVIMEAAGNDFEHMQMRGIIDKIERVLKCKLFVVSGDPVDQLNELHDSYITAHQTYHFKPIMNISYLKYEDVMGRKGGRIVCSRQEEKELSSLLLENDPLALKNWVQQYIRSLMEDPEVTPQSLEAAVHAVAYAANRWLERVTKASASDHKLDPLQLDYDEQPDDSLYNFLYSLMMLYHQELSDDKSTHVFKAIAYIDSHLGYNLLLDQVAKHVHLHPGHLSVIFKKETGQTFRDYVMQKKMKRAMEILTMTPAKVSDVANEVGYEDVKYFGQLFKKHTGMTPTEYRDQTIPSKNN